MQISVDNFVALSRKILLCEFYFQLHLHVMSNSCNTLDQLVTYVVFNEHVFQNTKIQRGPAIPDKNVDTDISVLSDGYTDFGEVAFAHSFILLYGR